MGSLDQRTEKSTTFGRGGYPERPRGKREETRRLRLTLGQTPSKAESSPAAVKYRVVLKCRCESDCESNNKRAVGKARVVKP
jgi:hypothetical protein